MNSEQILVAVAALGVVAVSVVASRGTKRQQNKRPSAPPSVAGTRTGNRAQRRKKRRS